MAAEFNPYHVWLGIPPEEQPANHYRLLGIRLFETVGEVVDSAADRQMAHLRTFQSGKHGDLTQRLLNEVAAARVCLLDPTKRAAYDQQLHAKLPPANAAGPVPGGSAIHRQPPRRSSSVASAAALPAAAASLPAASVPIAKALPQAVEQWDDLLGDPNATPANRSGSTSARPGTARENLAKQKDAKNRSISLVIAAAAVIVAIGIGVFSLNRSPSDGTLVFDWPHADRADTTIMVDNVSLPTPASGAWEFHGPAGPHHIVAQRLAFVLDANVDAVAGEKTLVPADWRPKAVLVLNWPLPLRNGAELRIDNRVQPPSQRDPLEVPVEPGRHFIQITRPDAAPIDRTAIVAADGRESVSITPPPSSAKLVFDWPVDQRQDAQLIIDGSRQAVPIKSVSAPTFALVVAPGQHIVQFSRTGFEPFNLPVELAAGTNQSLKPTWTPLQKAVPTVVENSVPAETVQPAKKLPIPAAAEQVQIAKQLDDLYKTSRSGAGSKDPAKAQELYDVAAKAGASAAERYMLLTKGAEIAAAGGDLNLSLQGIDTLDQDYDIDALSAKQKLLDRFVAAGKPDQLVAAVPTAEQLIDQAVAADRYETAVLISTAASRAAAKLPIATRKEAEERLSRRRRDIRLIEPIYAAATKAQETLDKNPADPKANLIVGRWECYYKGDWSAGLPLFTKSSDEKLKAIAEQELKNPTDAVQQIQLADAWWDLAQKEAGVVRDALHLHAGGVYQAALPTLGSALKKAAIEKRLAEIANLKPILAASGQAKPNGDVKFPLGQWVDVLRLVDTTSNVVVGTWSRSGPQIAVEAGEESRIAVPVAIEGSYDFEVEFTRISGQADVATMLSVGRHACMATLSGWDSTISGLCNVDGHDAFDPRNSIAVRPGNLENGHRYRLFVKVRIVSDDHASIDVSLDGKPYLPHWEGNPASLSAQELWVMPNPQRLGLGDRSQVIFRFARLRMVSGHASADASVAESAPPQFALPTAVPDVPIAAAKVPAGQWLDVLRLVDADENSLRGKWSRDGQDIVAMSSDNGSLLDLPVSIDGSYDLEVDFTRTQGDNDIHVIFPVGEFECNAVLSAYDGKVSGLYNLDTIGVNGSPINVRPGTLDNNRRYRLLISVRLAEENSATIKVSLDGKPYLPDWQGNPQSWFPEREWFPSDSHRIGIGQVSSQVAFQSIRVRMASGHAVPDTAAGLASKLRGLSVLSARWGSGDNWVDVTALVQTTIAHGKTAYASLDYCNADPAPNVKKQLQITYVKTGKKDTVNLDEGEHWARGDYGKL